MVRSVGHDPALSRPVSWYGLAAGCLVAGLLLTGCGGSAEPPAGTASRSPLSPGTSQSAPSTQPSASDSADRRPVRGVRLGVVGVGGQDLLLTREEHPRGGFQIRLYAGVGRNGGEAVVGIEVRTGAGAPAVPFVATDTRPVSPVAAACTADGIAVTTARPSRQRPGKVTWTVIRTDYRLEATTLRRQGRTRVGAALSTSALRARHPDLIRHAMFTDCLR